MNSYEIEVFKRERSRLLKRDLIDYLKFIDSNKDKYSVVFGDPVKEMELITRYLSGDMNEAEVFKFTMIRSLCYDNISVSFDKIIP